VFDYLAYMTQDVTKLFQAVANDGDSLRQASLV